ncbi:MAG: hypothetical protein LC798_07060 [Chloroflexi bacterium]|nr:hypothetical protein [Chloroflexota bacterium]
MPDAKVTELALDPAPAPTDRTVTVDDTLGTPVTKAATWAAVAASAAFSALYDPVGPRLLGSMAVIAAGSSGISTTIATLAASWWRLDPLDWTAPSGRSLEYRVQLIAQGVTSGATLYGTLTDSSAVPIFPEFSRVADGSATTSAMSGWQPLTAALSGFMRARLSSGTATAPACFIHVRHT